ncbi:MAG TPA: ATP-binding cassette domain-containing protein, partial [Firmicutes bacterium]|nr:ATP-binding cassette domain-containing protein [Bacillota bacterium]
MIRVEHLTKVYRSFDRREGILGALRDLFNRRYRDIRAVSDVSFSIDRGEMVGYIGANGAGKSTTIKMLTGILSPTSGEMVVNGLVPQKNRYAHARQIGVVFGQRTQLWWDLAVIEAFHLLQKIYQVPIEDYRKRLEMFIDVLDIREQLHQPVRKLSLGQRMKCDLAASLLHRPAILFLDEPTIGLDVAVKERIRRFVRFINSEYESTILLTTHDLTDIEELCPRIIIIDEGRILFDGPTEEIKRRFGHNRRVVLDFRRDYLPQYAEQPLPPSDLPLSFPGTTALA